MRGALTEKIQEIAKGRMGREISRDELLAYVDYVMKNEQKIDIRKVNQEDREILSSWRKKGYVEGGASGLAITRFFYDTLCEILWEGYVVGGADQP
jgi:hypothetical protein